MEISILEKAKQLLELAKDGISEFCENTESYSFETGDSSADFSSFTTQLSDDYFMLVCFTDCELSSFSIYHTDDLPSLHRLHMYSK